MGTTKVKVIDLSSDEPVVKASRKAAQKMRPVITDSTEESESTEKYRASPPSKNSEPPVIKRRASIETEEKAAPKVGAKQKAKEAGTASKPAAKVRPHGAKYKKAAESVDKNKVYPPKEALALLSKTSFTKFDPTVEIHINVNSKNIRGTINFPHPIGPKKEKKYLVFNDKKRLTESTEEKESTEKDKSSTPSKSSAPSVIKNVVWANDATIDDLASGRLKPGRDFNAVIASAKFMPQLASVAKILGPAGMMPNPKNGTITEEPEKIIGADNSGAYEFRSDPQAPIIHLKLGKLSAKEGALEENLKALVSAIGVSKIKKSTIKTTMSPAIKLDINSL